MNVTIRCIAGQCTLVLNSEFVAKTHSHSYALTAHTKNVLVQTIKRTIKLDLRGYKWPFIRNPLCATHAFSLVISHCLRFRARRCAGNLDDGKYARVEQISWYFHRLRFLFLRLLRANLNKFIEYALACVRVYVFEIAAYKSIWFRWSWKSTLNSNRHRIYRLVWSPQQSSCVQIVYAYVAFFSAKKNISIFVIHTK